MRGEWNRAGCTDGYSLPGCGMRVERMNGGWISGFQGLGMGLVDVVIRR